MRVSFLTVTLAVASAAALCGAAQSRDDDLAAQSISDMAAGFEAAAARLDTFRPLIDRSRFDPMEAVEALDFDADGIAAYVAEQIHYEPYDGILRGSLATLSSGAGNALDQSLLLLELIQTAGYDAQILKLDNTPPELAAALAQAAFRPRAGGAVVTDASQIAAWLQTVEEQIEGAEGYAGLGDAFAATQPQAIGDLVETVAAALGGEAHAAGNAMRPGAYYWVRYRMAPGMAWTEVHPALGGVAPDGLSPDTVLTGVADDAMLHYLTVELFAEILENDTLRLAPVMSPWRQPVAALLDRPLTLSMAVNRAEGGTAGASFIPMLDGRTAPGAMMTTLSGNMIDQGVLGMDSYGMSGIFTTMGDQLLDGAGLVAGRDEDRPTRATTGLMMRVTWTRPDGGERVEERWIIDRLVNRFSASGPPRLDLSMTREEALDRLNFSRSILVNPGGAHDAFVLDRTAQALGRRARYLAAMLGAYNVQTGEFDSTSTPHLAGSGHVPALTQMLSALDAPLDWPDGRSAFRHGPLVVSLHMDDAAAYCDDLQPGELNAFVDVLMNPWTGIELGDDDVLEWPQGAVIRGVRDTAIEVEHAGAPGPWDYLQRHGAQAIAVNAAQVAQWPQASRLAAEHDLEQGFSLVALPSADTDAPMLWWRVGGDGEVLGRHARGGFTQVYTERGSLQMSVEIQMMGDIVSVVSFANSVRQCANRPSPQARGCCLFTAIASGALGVAGGAGMGNLMTSQFATMGQALGGILALEVGGQVVGAGLDLAVCGSRGL